MRMEQKAARPAFHHPMPMNPMTGSRASASRPARFAFWLAAVLALLNLNHASNLVAGTGLPITVGLALCCAYLCLAARVPARRALGAPGFLIVAALASYFLIGVGVLLLTGEGLHTKDYMLPGHPVLAILVIVASALGASAILQRSEAEPLLNGVMAILAVACIFILMSPWLDPLYSLSDPDLRVAMHGRRAGRFIGFFSSPNYASIVACSATALALSLLFGGGFRMFAAPVVLLCSVAAFLTFTRTGFVVLTALFLFFLGISLSRLRLRRTFGVWPLAVTVLIAGVGILSIANFEYFGEYFVLKESQIDRLNWRHAVANFDESRFSLWSLGLSQIAESPLFGRGITHFHFLESASRCQHPITPCGVHSSYLMLWGEAGILPPSLLLLFIGSMLWSWWKLPKSVATNACAGCTIVFSVACVGVDGVPYFIGPSFLIGVSCAVMARAVRESRGRRPGQTLQAPSASVRTTAGGITPSETG